MKREGIYLLMAIHAHQPVDNFDHVFEEAFRKAYEPFIDVLSDFPEIKISLHISGSLLDWLLRNKPSYIHRIKGMVERGQVEMLTAGYYEPILVLLPDWDKIGQIQLHRSKMRHIFGVEPTGLWLTERVWEPSLPRVLKEAGIKFLIVDDEHFKIAGRDPEELHGYYLTEEGASEVAIFAGSKFLRYSMPFKPVEDTINYMRRKFDEGKLSIAFGDDLEKFGFWPHTYGWVYEEKWLYKFFKALMENKDWLRTIHFNHLIENYPPTGRIYLPCASYSEMMEWSDNMFRNFLVKYPESNHLQKRMFYLSTRLKGYNAWDEEFQTAKLHLYKAQNNDVYWHGIFGGLYLTHLRASAYKHLIKAEKIADKALGMKFPIYEVRDFDLDGKKEIIYKDEVYNIYLAPENGGVIYELDYKPLEHNIVDVLARRYEKYHEKIRRRQKEAVRATKGANPVSIHELHSFKDEDLEGCLIYDRYRKCAWIDHVYPGDIDPQLIYKNEVEELVQLYNMKYKYEVEKGRIWEGVDFGDFSLGKLLKVDSDKLLFEYEGYNGMERARYFAGEFNLLLYDPNLLSLREFQYARELKIRDEWFGIDYEFLFPQGVKFLIYPIETVSDSEAGIERTYQGISLYLIWELPKGSFSFRFQMRCKG